MNRDDERKRRFNEAIINTLYPPPPQDLEPVVEEDLIEELGSYSHVITGTLDDCENASTSGEEQEEYSETERLTRAQRKRIRKKKMKEEAIVRGKLIGPLMPPIQTMQRGDHDDHDDPPPVRSNASEEGDETTCAKSKKMKQRRMTKRVAKEKRDASALEKCNQSSVSSDAVDDMKVAPL
ncbi:hypothetical protein TSUD_226070 [Trifolium subterraneum]|uniref:Uncharacterized protein n=1 Tax=Trifolium subterraneum TaxID=3900 RepID=A0A2Z6M123_TRISU|nr:hypothetical protein TSUD_226070 [Trifolium subterraneum]